mgnify:CR=1 FL=1
MPTAIATLSKQTLRRDIAGPGGYRTRTTTGGGTTTTAIIAALSGIGSDYVLDMPWGLANDLVNAGEFHRAIGLSGTTVTFADAFSVGVIANATSMDFYPYPPFLYTEAANRAARKLYQDGKVYRLVNSHIISHADININAGTFYSAPRNMDRLFQIQRMGRQYLGDQFNRAAASVGNGWVQTTGSWDIIGEELRSSSDANADLLTYPLILPDGVIQASLRGTILSGATYRSPALAFRIADDYTGAIDTTNYLLVRLLNSQIQLRKVDAGTESSLSAAVHVPADGTIYQVRPMFRGANIRVWVDDVELLSYNLLGGDLKYLGYPRVGIRWDKAGAPATAARVSEYYAYNAQGYGIWPDWEQEGDNSAIEIPARGNVRPTGILYFEGMGPLSSLAADTASTVVSDSTAVVEMAATDRAYETFLMQARAELQYMLASQVYPTGLPESSEKHLLNAKAYEAVAKTMVGMTRPTAHGRHAIFN